MSARIEIDRKSNLLMQQQIDKMLEAGEKSGAEIITSLLFKMKAISQTRLTEREHVVTSRLKNSIFVKLGSGLKSLKKSKNKQNYKDNEGGRFVNGLKNVSLKETEGAFGTNVEYGEKIENRDSFLRFATRNIDKDVNKYVNEVAKKFNKYIK